MQVTNKSPKNSWIFNFLSLMLYKNSEIITRKGKTVPPRPQNAYVKSKVYMAVDSENPKMYQMSWGFCFKQKI